MVELIAVSLPTELMPPPVWPALLKAIVLLTSVRVAVQIVGDAAAVERRVVVGDRAGGDRGRAVIEDGAAFSCRRCFMNVLSVTERVPLVLAIAPPWKAAPPVKVLLVTVTVPWFGVIDGAADAVGGHVVGERRVHRP